MVSNRFNTPPPSDPPGAARRRVVASYTSYEEAERAVDTLSDAGFPVERTTIIGRGLKYVERVTGRMTYARAALQGALTGAIAGLLIGWLFVVFDWFDPIVSRGWLIVDAVWFGALVGASMGLVQHAVLGGRRDFASVGGMEADRYEVLVDERFADEAEQLLGTAAAREPAAARDPEPTPEAGPAAS